MKCYLILFFVIIGIKSSAQETLQTITNRGNSTSNILKIQRPVTKIDNQAVSEFSGIEFNSTLWGEGAQNYLLLINPNASTFRFAVDYDGHGSGGTFSNIQFGTKNNGYLHIQNYGGNAGNVGIGTTSPQEKLSVNGKIRAKEVKVEVSNWPDYVLKPDYKLSTLEETEKHILEKGYLPDMPNAKQVAKEGIELGKMNKLLLKKIEELTLHLIEKEKQLNKEKEKNINQDRRIIILEEKLNKLIK